MYTVGAYLGKTLEELNASMSAQAFAGWMCWMGMEDQGVRAQQRRHAEQLAAAHNSTRVRHAKGRLFEPADFMPADPWAPAPEKPKAEAVSPADFVARLSARRAAMRPGGAT